MQGNEIICILISSLKTEFVVNVTLLETVVSQHGALKHTWVLSHPTNAVHMNDNAGPPTPNIVMILLTFMTLKWPLLISQSAAKLNGKDAKYIHRWGNADNAPFCKISRLVNAIML